MLVKDFFRSQFYDNIKREPSLVIANGDLDALCASVILAHTFQCDEAAFTLHAVDNWDQVESVLHDHRDSVKHVVMLNCGATRSLVDLAEKVGITRNINFYVIDSRRPFNLDNIFNESVRLLCYEVEAEQWNVPNPKDVYGSGDEDSDSESDEEEEGGRRRVGDRIERRLIRRQRREQWRRNKKRLVFEYYMKQWYSVPSSVIVLDLAHELGRSSAEMMWCTVVGLSSQLTDHLISSSAYSTVCVDRLRPFIRKFQPRALGGDEPRVENVMKVAFERELPLPFYSHWTVEKSIAHHTHFVVKSKLWTQKGQQNLRDLIASLGLTLNECRQNFSAMSGEMRKNIFDILDKAIDLSFFSFTAHCGYARRYNAYDFALAMSLKLEVSRTNAGDDKPLSERFTQCFEDIRAFNRWGVGDECLTKPIEKYKIALQKIVQMAFTSLNQALVVMQTHYCCLTVLKTPDTHLLRSRHCLNFFCHFLQLIYASTSKQALNRRGTKPLIVSVPLDDDEVDGWYLITGLMPLSSHTQDTMQKSLIGKAFETVIQDAKIQTKEERFDSNVVIIRGHDRIKFHNILETRIEAVQ